jgi:hypothetical protein
MSITEKAPKQRHIG